jgi:hypothetical protein
MLMFKILIAVAVLYGVATFGSYLVVEYVGQVSHRYLQIA